MCLIVLCPSYCRIASYGVLKQFIPVDSRDSTSTVCPTTPRPRVCATTESVRFALIRTQSLPGAEAKWVVRFSYLCGALYAGNAGSISATSHRLRLSVALDSRIKNSNLWNAPVGQRPCIEHLHGALSPAVIPPQSRQRAWIDAN